MSVERVHGSDSQPLRLAFLTDIVTPYMSAVFEALAQRSRLTVLFSAARGSRGADWAIGDSPRANQFVVGGTVIRRGVDSTDYYPSPRILGALARAHPDGIVVGGFSFPALYAAVYSRFVGCALAIHSDGTSDSEREISRGQRLARAVMLRACGCAVANSAAAERRFLELGVRPGRLFRANHTTNIEPLWAVARQRSEAPAEGPLRVISVGRLIPRKGIDLLIEAVARAVGAGVDLRLNIVGSGPEEGRLRELARERELGSRVRFHGFVDQPQLPALYAEAEVFAFPTLEDPFGIVALEAAAAGLAIIGGRDAGATQELVRHGETGLATDPRDVERTAAHLADLAADRGRTAAMGRAAHRETLERTPDAAAQGYLAAIGEARARRGSAVTRGRA